jgi:hypothetical protein
MRTAKDTAEVASFLICLCLGFTVSFGWVLPAIRDVQMELMKHLFAVSFGFGIGVCFFLIYLPIQDLVVSAFKTIAAKIDAVDEMKQAKQKKKGPNQDES